MSMVYEWKPDSRFPVGAQIAAERLQQIRLKVGGITPRAVVDDAKSHKSPLHRCFEWDNDTAADNYRLTQARKLIGSIVVAQIDETPVRKETRAFVNVQSVGSYQPIEVAMDDVDMRAEVLAKAKSEISMWRARYAAYEEFGKLHSSIDEILAA